MPTVTATDLREAIVELKAQKRALLLAHNYQIPEIQDLADFLGDSLALAKKAKETDAPILLFCGVHFMAETASILCPEKKVLLPDLEAGCSLAETISAEQLRAWKLEHPQAVVVSYVNTSAAVKALSDYCCTSSNAVQVIESIPEDREILFLPDMFLGHYVQHRTGRKLQIWPGECHVHAGLRPADVQEKLKEHPNAEFLIHPECGCTTQSLYYLAEGSIERGKILSTGGMLQYSQKSCARKFVVGTEVGILHRLRKENPDKEFEPLREDAICQYMKKNTLEKVLRSLHEEVYEVRVAEEIACPARRAIERMIAIS